jgi:hypothetical protein
MHPRGHAQLLTEWVLAQHVPIRKLTQFSRQRHWHACGCILYGPGGGIRTVCFLVSLRIGASCCSAASSCIPQPSQKTKADTWKFARAAPTHAAAARPAPTAQPPAVVGEKRGRDASDAAAQPPAKAARSEPFTGIDLTQ